MASSHSTDLETIEAIINTINQHNSSVDQEERIVSLYSGTSDPLDFIGMTVVVTSFDGSQIVTIPRTLLPKKHLRKEYGINIVEENHDKNKENYQYLASTSADQDGISKHIHSLLNQKRPLSIAQIHSDMTETILNMHSYNYIRNLKKILVLATYMMLIDPDGKEKARDYMALLENEKKAIQSEFQGKLDTRPFAKYMPRIKSILEGKTLSFQVDEHLRSAIHNRYPILYCAVIDPNNKHALPLDSVKMMFTPNEHLDKLQQKVEKMNLKVKVLGYNAPRLKELSESASEDELSFLNAANINDLHDLTHHKPHLLNSNEFVKAKIKQCLTAHFQGEKDSHFAMAVLLMKKMPPSLVLDMASILEKQFNFNLYEIVRYKGHFDKDYLKNLTKVVSEDYVNRLNDLSYLRSLLTLRLYEDKQEKSNIFDYSHPSEKLESLFVPSAETFEDRSDYLLEYILRLQHLHVILKKDFSSDPENVNKHLAHVKSKYVKAVKEYQQTHKLSYHILHSELYKETEKRSLILLFFGPATHKNEPPPTDKQLHNHTGQNKSG